MHKTDCKDLPETPLKLVSSMKTAVTNAVHLAGLLKMSGYQAEG